MKPLLEVQNLRKNYGKVEALIGVTLHVNPGELFGLLGPNGAGKTTFLSILACLQDPSAGTATLFGKALQRNDFSLRQSIGIGTQDLALYAELTARENLRFFGKLYGIRGKELESRVHEVLEWTGLRDRADQRTGTYSGGMKRRLNLGVAVIHQPKLLLLDEPTTGVDPQSRNHIFEQIRRLNAAGMTIIYTSHYMEEVQTLCPRIGIMDHGKIIACDTLAGLLQLLEGELRLTVSHNLKMLREPISRLPGVRIIQIENEELHLAAKDLSATVIQIVALLRQSNIELTSLHSQEPTLERVFLYLTENRLRD